jgi:hypothetical protein
MSEEDEGIDRLRRRFSNNYPNFHFLNGGNWNRIDTDRPWWSEDPHKIGMWG